MMTSITRNIDYNNINSEDVSSLYKGVKIETLSNVTINNVEFNNKKYNLIKYNGKCNPEDKSNGILRSVIARENGKILAVDRKTFKVDEFIKRGNEATSIIKSSVSDKDVRIEQYISGPKLRLFYDEIQNDDERSEWVVCTKSNIGANNRYFVDAGASEGTYSYQKMFIEACNHTGLKYLNVLPKHLQYMFVMKHPKNITVYNVKEPELHLIGVNEITKDNQVIIHSLESVAEYFKNTKVQFPKIISECNVNDVAKMSSDYLLDNQLSLENHNNNDYPTYKEEGIMFIHKTTFEFSKCINPQYEMVKSILGNQPKMEFRYAELWSDTVMNVNNDANESKLTLFIKYFPEFIDSYKTFYGKMSQFLKNVYTAYIDCFIHKTKPLKEFPFQYRPHLFEIHNLYKNELRPNGKNVSLPVVYKYFANLPTAKIMFALNYEYRIASVTEKQ
jgi:hypothetical protein